MDQKGDKKAVILNRVFYTVLLLLILASVVMTFYKIVIKKDYQITAEVSCDPNSEKCFVRNTDEEVSYYKIISKKASTIQACEATEEKLGCLDELSCVEGETSCFYTYDTSE